MNIYFQAPEPTDEVNESYGEVDVGLLVQEEVSMKQVVQDEAVGLDEVDKAHDAQAGAQLRI